MATNKELDVIEAAMAKPGEIKIQISKGAFASASPEMVAKVKESETMTLLDGRVVELGQLPNDFLLDHHKLTILHLIYLRTKYPSMAMAHDTKTGLVSICLGRD